ncbi:MAG: hypothetical protein ABI554_01480 [Flavobacterium sp.]
MKNYSLPKIYYILVFVGCCFSCSSDLDFNQANDLKLEPVVVGNLSNFNVPAAAFVGANNLLMNAQDFDVFRDKHLNSYLQRADLYFEINNTIARSYALDIDFTDANDQILTTIHFDIPAYNGSENKIIHTEYFQDVKLVAFKNAKKMKFRILMNSGIPTLNQNSSGSLQLRSSATLYLEIE